MCKSMYENQPDEWHGLTPGGLQHCFESWVLSFRYLMKVQSHRREKAGSWLRWSCYFKVAPGGVTSLIVGMITIMMMMWKINGERNDGWCIAFVCVFMARKNIDGCCRATLLHCSDLMLYISRIFVPFLSNLSLPLILLHFNFFLTFGRPRWPSLSLQIIHNPIKASCQPMRCRTAYRLTTAAINITDANRGFPIVSVLILRYLWYK